MLRDNKNWLGLCLFYHFYPGIDPKELTPEDFNDMIWAANFLEKREQGSIDTRDILDKNTKEAEKCRKT